MEPFLEIGTTVAVMNNDAMIAGRGRRLAGKLDVESRSETLVAHGAWAA